MGRAARRVATVALALVVLADLIPDRYVTYRLRDAIVTDQLDKDSYALATAGRRSMASASASVSPSDSARPTA